MASLTSIFALSPEPTTAIAASVFIACSGRAIGEWLRRFMNGHTLTGVLRGVVGLLVVLSIALGLNLSFWMTGVSV